MAVKFESTRTMPFKPSGLMPGMDGYGNVMTSRLNKGGDAKWRGKRKSMNKNKGMGGAKASTKTAYGY